MLHLAGHHLLLHSPAEALLVVAVVPCLAEALLVVAEVLLLLLLLLLLGGVGCCWARGPRGGVVLQVVGAGLGRGLLAAVVAWAQAGLAWALHPLALLLVLHLWDSGQGGSTVTPLELRMLLPSS